MAQETETVEAATEDVATEPTQDIQAEDATAETSTDEAAPGDSQDSAPASSPASSADRERAFYGNATGQSELSDALSVQSESDAERKEVPGGRAYEIIYIARVGDAEATEATSTRLRTLIESTDGAIDNVRATETRRLAYPVAGENDGIYMVVNARLIPTQLPEIDRFFKLEESVLRHMVLKENGR